MEDLNFRKGDAKTDVFGSDRMLQPSPVEKIPDGPTTPEVAYQMVCPVLVFSYANATRQLHHPTYMLLKNR